MNFFFIVQEFLIFFEVPEGAQKYYSHVPVDAIYYVDTLSLGSENHVSIYKAFKFVQFMEFYT